MKKEIKINKIEIIKFEKSIYYILPDSNFRLEIILNYNKLINQNASLRNINNYKQEISTARTFCMLSDIIKYFAPIKCYWHP